MKAIKLSPIYETARILGATMVQEDGWMMPQSYSQAAAGLPNIGLMDQSNCGKILVHGSAGRRSVVALGIEPPEEIGQGVIAAGLAVYRLRADQIFISTSPSSSEAALEALQTSDVGDEQVTVTDVTHGRAQLRLVGPASAELLGRICPLDFHSTHFPNAFARQSSVANTTQLIIRDDLANGSLLSYVIIGARSLGIYLWNILLESGSDLGIRPLGSRDLIDSLS